MISHIARQPIFTGNRDVFGYELLFRSGPENVFSAVDGDAASASVVADAVHLHDLDSLGSGGKCFINVTAKIMIDELYAALPREQVVLELLEDIEPDSELLAACAKCGQAGYSLALDDYVLQDKFQPLMPLIDFLKVDFMGTTREQQQAIMRNAGAFGFKLLAEKVESYEDFHSAKELGYDFFQGFFFCKPEMISKKDVSPSSMAYMQLLQQISQPMINHDKLEGVIRQDPALSYKLLRHLNSGAFRFRHEVTSIHRALVLLGDEPLRKWASLMVLSILGEAKPPELLNICMVRARLCEMLMQAAGKEEQAPDAFMVGMFSVLAAMLDQPLEQLLNSICLPEHIERTLRGEQTPLRPVLDAALALESGDWNKVSDSLGCFNICESTIGPAYIDCLKWAAEQTKVMKPAPKSKAA